MTSSYRVRRAQLYIPGDDPKKIEKGAGLGVDSLILDLEDGVALSRKVEARQVVVQSLAALDFGRSERLVRINAIGSGFEADDLAAALSAHPDGIVIPKIEEAAHVQWASQRIAEAEEANGWTPGAIRLLILIETAKGIVNLKEIAGSDDRLDALIFGAYDMSSSIGATLSRQETEMLYMRGAIVTHAAAFGLQAIDSVFIDLHDLEALSEAAARALHMGFSGKQAIHPRQIEPIEAVFTPDSAAIESARRLVDAYREHQQQGQGVFAYEGKMIDMPLLRAAENVLARARAAGKLA